MQRVIESSNDLTIDSWKGACHPEMPIAQINGSRLWGTWQVEIRQGQIFQAQKLRMLENNQGSCSFRLFQAKMQLNTSVGLIENRVLQTPAVDDLFFRCCFQTHLEISMAMG